MALHELQQIANRSGVNKQLYWHYYEALACLLLIVYSQFLHDVIPYALGMRRVVELIGPIHARKIGMIYKHLIRTETKIYRVVAILVDARCAQAFSSRFGYFFGVVFFATSAYVMLELKRFMFKIRIQHAVLTIIVLLSSYLDEPLSLQILMKSLYTLLFVQCLSKGKEEVAQPDNNNELSDVEEEDVKPIKKRHAMIKVQGQYRYIQRFE